MKGALQFIHPRYWLLWLGFFIVWLISMLPYPLLALLGRGLGSLLYLIAGRRAHIVDTNLRLCFPDLEEAERKRLMKRHFQALGQAVLGIGINLFASARRLQRLTRFRDRQYFDHAIDAGKPIILLAPHFVGMEIAGLVLAPERHMLSMYQPIRNPFVDWMVRRGRERFGGIMIEHRAPMRQTVRRIRDGSPFYYLPDQDPGSGDKVFAPFFGIQTAVTPGLSGFARLTGAAVIPCFTKLRPGGRGFEVIFLPPLEAFPSGDPVVDARRMNEVIEQGIAEMPEQYFWVHRRFKSRPDGEERLY